jgi:hypothetical protein
MKKYIPHAIILAMAVLLLYSMERCSHHGSALRHNSAALADTVAYFNNAMGTQTATVKTLMAGKQELESIVIARDKQLAQAASHFARVNTVVKYKTSIEVDTVYVAFNAKPDSLPAYNHAGAVFDKWYSFDYNINNRGLQLTNLSLQTETAVVTGIKRKWFLGTQTLTTDVSNTNPYITVIQLQAAEVTLPVPVYKKWYVWLGAGLLGGFILAK